MMAGPWEKYQAASEGPWAKYGGATPPEPAKVAEPVAESSPRRPRVAKLPTTAAVLPQTPSSAELAASWSKAGRGVDDFVRSVANGMTFNFADELAAGANSVTTGAPYSETYAAEQARTAQIDPNLKLAGELAGGLALGTGLGRNGITFLNSAKPTYGSMIGRGAAEGAAYGAAYGAGSGEGAQGRIENAAFGSLIGAGAGGAAGAIAANRAQPAASTRPKIPTTQQLREQSQAAYKAAENAGVAVNDSSFASAVDDIVATARKEGIDTMLHPDATAALSRLQKAKGAAQTLEEIEILRRVANDATAAQRPADRRIANIIVDKIDDYVGKLAPDDLISGDTSATQTLKTARELWARKSKSETVEKLVERAQISASAFSGSGYENALRTEFRNLAKNEAKMRRFSATEQEAIKRVAMGGPLENTLRMLGKFAPTGVVSSVLSGGAGAAIAGGPGAVAVPALGYAARQGATAMTAKNVQSLSDLVRSGSVPLGPRPLTPIELALGRSYLVGQAQLAPAMRADSRPRVSTGR